MNIARQMGKIVHDKKNFSYASFSVFSHNKSLIIIMIIMQQKFHEWLCHGSW